MVKPGHPDPALVLFSGVMGGGMNDLSVWDITSDFTGKDAAALIVGEKPMAGNPANWRPVIERMQRSYESARGWHVSAIVEGLNAGETLPAEALGASLLRVYNFLLPGV